MNERTFTITLYNMKPDGSCYELSNNRLPISSLSSKDLQYSYAVDMADEQGTVVYRYLIGCAANEEQLRFIKEKIGDLKDFPEIRDELAKEKPRIAFTKKGLGVYGKDWGLMSENGHILLDPFLDSEAPSTTEPSKNSGLNHDP